MIPQFPKFKSLELSDKEEVEKITNRFRPYSDFNFVSMWSWNIDGTMLISQLHGNLVVRFRNYLTGEPFYSFIGDKQANETAKALIDLSKKEGLKQELRLMPEDSIKNLDINIFNIKEDEDNFDYIYHISNMAQMKGGRYETHRNLINQFNKIHKNWRTGIVNLSDVSHKNNIISVFKKWADNKKDSSLPEDKNEFLSLSRLLSLDNHSDFNLTCFVVYVDDKMVGFIINEYINDHNIIHFEKADTSFKGSFTFLMKHNSKMLEGSNLKYLNFEQDLGQDTLRFTKKKFQPVHFLKKYLVTYRD